MPKFGSKGVLDWEFYCKIRLLDDTELTIDFKKESKGADIFNAVCKEIDLLEKDYFGLRYVDGEKQRHWLDLNKNVIKQMKAKPPYTLFFRVKFYAADTASLVEEITRYYFFLQIKRDILHGRLLCSFNDLAELGGYIIQDEVGDYDEKDNSEGYVSEFRIVPKQGEKLEQKIHEYHKSYRGFTPAMCEEKFLAKVITLEMYGVDPHPCKDQDGVQLYLGLTPTGIAIIRDAKKVSGFVWNQVHKVSYDARVFYVQVYKENGRANYGFRLPDPHACKHLWKCAVEHHAFYSNNRDFCSSTLSPQRRTPSKFLRRHRFEYRGPTHKDVVEESQRISRPGFEIKRTGSIRISRRPPKQSLSESIGVGLSDDPVQNGEDHKDTNGNEASDAAEVDPLKEFETTDFPEPKAEESQVTDNEEDVTDSVIIANHLPEPEAAPVPPEPEKVIVDEEPVIIAAPVKAVIYEAPPPPVVNFVAKPADPVIVVPPPRPISRSVGVQTDEIEDTSAKNMLIFVLVLLAILLVPIAIIWERRKLMASSIVGGQERPVKQRGVFSLFTLDD